VLAQFTELRARAEHDEQRASKAEASVLGLAELVSRLRAELAVLRPVPRPKAPPPEPPPVESLTETDWLDSPVAERLVKALGWWITRDEILWIAPKLIAGTEEIEPTLKILAAARGMRLVTSRKIVTGMELFRFEPL
jgi:hypothetical protein